MATSGNALIDSATSKLLSSQTPQSDVSSPTGTLPIANGGTGATSALVARSNLGAASSGSNSDITSLSGLTTPLSVAQGGSGTTTSTGSGSVVLSNSPTIVTPTIASFANSTHNHVNAAGGGQITDAALSSPVTVPKGGTGLTAGTSGGILGFTGSTTVASSVALTANQIVLGGGAGSTPIPLGSLGTATQVLHGNAGGAPTFSAVSLTADVSGTLPVANGGTGDTTLTAHGVLVGNGTGAVAVTSVGATGTVLHGNTGADPTYSAVSLTADVSGTLPIANGGTAATTAENARISLGTIGIFSTTTGINGLSVAQTNLYTPSGHTAIVTGANVRMTTATGLTGTVRCSIGTDSGASNIFSNTIMTAFDTTGETWRFSATGNYVTVASGTTIKFSVNTAFGGTTVTLAVDLQGYLI